ncbi:hypothetical protein CDV31_002026 [Fusarium ambrosium]|uniref:Uncharacterized protein n=1 Tax=Fusarium ambrosium TaxID=131363 RepID=A0A428UXR5_9HYPO|nr:hypothetical protein CDV31_002026 [Fusarium ambrosium]
MDKTVAITIQKQHRKADLTKWPLNANGPTNDPDFVRIWDVNDSTDGASHTPPTKKQESGKKAGKAKKRSTGDLTEARTGFLDDLRNTVAGVAAEKFLIEKLVEDSVHLKDANRNLSHKVSSMANRR